MSSVLAKMAIQISANTAEFNKALTKTSKDINQFTKGIESVATNIAAAFGIQQIGAFTLEVTKLAGQFEGVNSAFKRLPDNVKLLEDLKAATGNTVSELELMKKAVQASNFDISLKALPKLLEFATLRAQQTGQSVDYLVDSIVTGIGRKSKLILDNLGISAVQLTEALGGASTAASSIGDVADAVGKIAESNLKNMAGFSDNAANRILQLSASWDNLKVSIGALANDTGVLPKTIQLMDGFIKRWNQIFTGKLADPSRELDLAIINFSNKFKTFKDQLEDQGGFNAALEKIAKIAEQSGKQIVKLSDETGKTVLVIKPFVDTINEGSDAVKKQTETYDSLVEQLKDLNTQWQTIDKNDNQSLNNIGKQIIALDSQIKKLDELRKAKEAQKLQFIIPEDAGSLFGDQSNVKAINDFKEFENGLKNIELQAGATKIALEGVSATTKTVTANMLVSAEAMNDALKGLAAQGIAQLADAFGSALAGGENFGKAMLGVLLGFASQFGQILISLGVAALAAWNIIKSPAGAVAAIAAGAALVAIAGAARQSLKSSHASNFGGSGGGSGRSSLSGNSFASASQAQNTLVAETVIRGQDLWVIFQNYQNNNKSTRG